MHSYVCAQKHTAIHLTWWKAVNAPNIYGSTSSKEQGAEPAQQWETLSSECLSFLEELYQSRTEKQNKSNAEVCNLWCLLKYAHAICGSHMSQKLTCYSQLRKRKSRNQMLQWRNFLSMYWWWYDWIWIKRWNVTNATVTCYAQDVLIYFIQIVL